MRRRKGKRQGEVNNNKLNKAVGAGSWRGKGEREGGRAGVRRGKGKRQGREVNSNN